MEGLLEEVRAELDFRFRIQTGKGIPGKGLRGPERPCGARGEGAAWGGTASNRADVQWAPPPGLRWCLQGSFPFQHLCICFTGIRKTERERWPFCGKLPLEFFKGSGRVSYTIKC